MRESMISPLCKVFDWIICDIAWENYMCDNKYA